MKRKPRRGGGEEETGESAAELEVMVMVVLVVITMFCSSSAPLSPSHTHTRALSFSLSLFFPFFPCLPLGKEFRINGPAPLADTPLPSPFPPPTHRLTAQPRPSHPGMTSLHRRDNTGAERALTAGKRGDSALTRGAPTSPHPHPGWDLGWTRRELIGGGRRLRRATGALRPNWVGGHVSVRPLPYLERRCKTGPTCHRRAMTGLSWAQLFSATHKQQNLPFFFFF